MIKIKNQHLSLFALLLCSVITTSAFAGKLTKKSDDLCSRLMTTGLSDEWFAQSIARQKEEFGALQKLKEIVKNNGIAATFLNREIVNRHTNTYTKEIPTGTITDQAGSGRCWEFSSLNLIRSLMISKGWLKPNFEFSETYLWFFYLQKQANEHFERVILNRDLRYYSSNSRDLLTAEIAQGGSFQVFASLVKDHGLAPKSAMPETIATQNPTMLMNDLNHQVAVTTKQIELAAQGGADATELQAIREKGNRAVFNVLCVFLGIPPTEFKIGVDQLEKNRLPSQKIKNGQITFTPKQFFEYTDFNPDDYITVSAYPMIKNNRYYVIQKNEEDKTGYIPLSYLNLGVKRMKELIKVSIDRGIPVLYAADVEKNVDQKSGIMHPDLYERSILYNQTPEQRQNEFSRKDDNFFQLRRAVHAMMFAGYDQPTPTSEIVKYKTINSWGPSVGDNGVFATYPTWVEQYVFEIVVLLKDLKAREQNLLKEPHYVESDEAFGNKKK